MQHQKIQKQIWSRIQNTNQQHKLSTILSIYDQTINYYKLDPTSEAALHIYKKIIQQFRNGSLAIVNSKKSSETNMFSFGKENNLGTINNLEQVTKVLNFEDKKFETMKKKKGKKSQRSGQRRRRQQMDEQEQIRTDISIYEERIDELMRNGLVKKINTFYSELKFRKQRKRLCIRMKDEKKRIFFKILRHMMKQRRRQLNRLKQASADFIYRQNKLRKYLDIFKQIKQKSLYHNQKASLFYLNYTSKNKLQSYFQSWKNYATRLQSQKKYQQILQNKKNILRKIIFFHKFKTSYKLNLHFKSHTSKINLLSQKIFLHSLLHNLINSKKHQDKTIQSINIYRKLIKRKFIKKLGKKVIKRRNKTQMLEKYLKMRKIYRFIWNLKNYFDLKKNKFEKYKNKIQFLYYFLSSLPSINKQLINKNRLKIFQKKKIKQHLDKKIIKICFYEFVGRMNKQKGWIKAIIKNRKKNVLKMMKIYKCIKQGRQTLDKKMQLLKGSVQCSSKMEFYRNLRIKRFIEQKVRSVQNMVMSSNKRRIFLNYNIGKSCKKYVKNREKQAIIKYEQKLLHKYFKNIKNVVLSGIYERKIINLLRSRKNQKVLKILFTQFKQYTFHQKILKLKTQNLKLFRLKQYAHLFFHQIQILYKRNIQSIQHQCIIENIHKQNKTQKIFQYWKIYTYKSIIKHKLYASIHQTYQYNRLKKLFEVLRMYKNTKINQRYIDKQIQNTIVFKKKSKFFNILIKKAITSIRLSKLYQIVNIYYSRKALVIFSNI